MGARPPQKHPQPLGYFGEAKNRRKSVWFVKKEQPKLRPCLGTGCDHLLLSTKANRICEKGRATIARIVGECAFFEGTAEFHRPGFEG